MNGWLIFLIIALVMGVIVSNLMLLKYTAKFKIPDSVLKSIKERNQKEKLEETKNKKPTDD